MHPAHGPPAQELAHRPRACLPCPGIPVGAGSGCEASCVINGSPQPASACQCTDMGDTDKLTYLKGVTNLCLQNLQVRCSDAVGIAV